MIVTKALDILTCPVVAVHMFNIHTSEPFRLSNMRGALITMPH